MDYGFSLLLREVARAAEIEHGDCEAFQIVCPECREPVFKKTRAGESGPSHFLSHFRAETEEERDCDLRVNAASPGRLAEISAEGRGQTLRRFLAVLGKAIADSQLRNFGQRYPDYLRRLNSLESKPHFGEFAPYAREAMDMLVRKAPDPRALVSQSLAGFPEFSRRSPFWHRRQASYVLDVMEHLLTPQARPNLRRLAAAAYLNIGLQPEFYERRIPERDADPLAAAGDWRGAFQLVRALVAGKSASGMRKEFARVLGPEALRSKEAGARKAAALHYAFVGELAGPLMGILASIPFPDLAQDRNAAAGPDADLLRMLDAIREILKTGREPGPGGPR
jgi:hypothetical protein